MQEVLRDVDRRAESLSHNRNTLKAGSACCVPKIVIFQSTGLYLTEKLGVNLFYLLLTAYLFTTEY